MDELTRRMRSKNLGVTLAYQGRKGRWLASQVGVSESSISRLISGKQTTDERVARRISEILAVPIDVLFESAAAYETSASEAVA